MNIPQKTLPGDLTWAFFATQLREIENLMGQKCVLPYLSMSWTQLRDTYNVRQRFPVRAAMMDSLLKALEQQPYDMDSF